MLHFVQEQYQTYCSGTVAKAKAKMAKVTKPFKEKKEKKSKSEKKQVEERGDKTGARKAVEGVPEQPPGVPWTVGPWKGCASPDEIEKADELMIARLKRGWSERPDPRTISSTAASSSGSARPLEEDDDRTETEAPQQEVKPKAIKAKAKARARWTTGSLQPEAVDAAESQQEAVDAAESQLAARQLTPPEFLGGFRRGFLDTAAQRKAPPAGAPLMQGPSAAPPKPKALLAAPEVPPEAPSTASGSRSHTSNALLRWASTMAEALETARQSAPDPGSFAATVNLATGDIQQLPMPQSDSYSEKQLMPQSRSEKQPASLE